MCIAYHLHNTMMYTYHWKVYGHMYNWFWWQSCHLQYPAFIDVFGKVVSLASFSKVCLFKSTLNFGRIFYRKNNHNLSLLCINSSEWLRSFIAHTLSHITSFNVSLHWLFDTFPKLEHLNTYSLCFVTWICQNYIFNSI